MRSFLRILYIAALALLSFHFGTPSAEGQSISGQTAEYGIAVKRPVFAGACKACPWGELATITKEALSHYGYDVQICYTCATTIGTRDMADKMDNQQDLTGLSPYSEFSAYVELTPRRVPDISATGVSFLVDAWNGTGAFAPDNKKRQNYRIIGTFYSVSYYAIAVAKRTGITNLSQVKTRRNTWVVAPETDPVLAYYDITKASLEANGGGIISTNASRERRAGADVWIGNAALINTWENRMWYEISQMVDLAFLDLEPALIEKMVRDGFTRVTIPIGLLRGLQRSIPTVSRMGGTAIYVRDEAPEDFAYTVAKALDEYRDLFRMQIQPWYYDSKDVAKTTVIPLHLGAARYYRERGYIK